MLSMLKDNSLIFLPNLFSGSSVFEDMQSVCNNINWSHIYTTSTKHNISAVVWDYFQQAIGEGVISQEQLPTKMQKIQWALAVEQIEKKYVRQRGVIAKLAKLFVSHNIKMMILKGYGLSLNYPVPNHRPCSDVDIWLFEERQMSDGTIKRCSAQQSADRLLHEHLNIVIDDTKHHHTVFYVDGVMVENHYDFLNIHAHLSNRKIEQRLQHLTNQPLEQVELDGQTVYLPSPDFNALFLLRHSASHFAAERIVIRHLLDWRYYVEKFAQQIDWAALYDIATQTNMHKFLNCINSICIDRLNLPSSCVPPYERDKQLEERVWNEILQPEFSESKPKNAGYLKSWGFMFRRWWASRWKHQIVYNESLGKTFVVQVWSHLLKPKSLKLK